MAWRKRSLSRNRRQEVVDVSGTGKQNHLHRPGYADYSHREPFLLLVNEVLKRRKSTIASWNILSRDSRGSLSKAGMAGTARLVNYN